MSDSTTDESEPACATPFTRGPMKGNPTTGTMCGYNKHIVARDDVCDLCRVARTEYQQRQRAANPERTRRYSREWDAAHREQRAENERRRREANPEKVAEQKRRYREAHPDADSEHYRRYYAENREVLLEKTRQWYRDNAEYVRERNREWRAAHPELVKEWARRRRARLAEVLTIPFTPEQLQQRMSYWGNRCWMCGGPFEEVDHVIPIALNGPHCLSNLRPACKSCNASKGAKAAV